MLNSSVLLISVPCGSSIWINRIIGFLECCVFLGVKLLAVFSVNIAVKQRKCKMSHEIRTA